MLRLLGLLRRPEPLGEVDAALAVVIRRRVLELALVAGTACLVRRPGT
jgi:hypothetical protein